jgi:hypothetical protein
MNVSRKKKANRTENSFEAVTLFLINSENFRKLWAISCWLISACTYSQVKNFDAKTHIDIF